MKFPPEWTKSPNIKRKRTRDNRASRLKIGLSYSERNEVTKFLRRNYIKDADTRQGPRFNIQIESNKCTQHALLISLLLYPCS